MKRVLCIRYYILSILGLLLVVNTVAAEPDCNNPGYGDIDYCLSKIQGEIDALTPAHENNKNELAALQKQVKNIKYQIGVISGQLDDLAEEIKQREGDLLYTKEIFNEKTSNHYRFLRTYDPLTPFLSSRDASHAIQEMIMRMRAADEDRLAMEELAAELIDLKNDKDELTKNKDNLASAEANLDARADFLGEEVEKVETYLTTLSSKQQNLIALKEAGFQTSIGETPPTMEPCSGPPGTASYCDPGFRPAFGGFSFGAPHRTGMSQYGALGRSKSGQSAETILSAYYQGASLQKGFAVPDTIGVDGIGRVSFEENYLLGIYEVPERWGDEGGFEALKAQAVAARSFALAATNNGAGSICTSEACQVYKPQLKSGKWAEAVRATRGWVLTRDGAPAKTYYSASTGGYTVSQWGWTGIKDTSGAWPDSAYEKIAGSPWFYKGWYKSRGGASCGRGNPWLTSAEMADIINAWQILYKGGGDVSRISPVNTDCWAGNPYSISELASVGGYNSVSSASVVYNNGGYTSSVTFGTNKGTVTIDGAELKKAFNLRAPGYVGIKSSLFNIEKL